jgi:hypothetical protein
VKSKRQWISNGKKNRSKCCSQYMMILPVGATLDVIRREIKFLPDISGMGSWMTLMNISRRVISARRYIMYIHYNIIILRLDLSVRVCVCVAISDSPILEGVNIKLLQNR